MAFPWDVLLWGIRLRFKLTPPAAADGELVDAQGDANGNLKVRVVNEGPSNATPVRQKAAARRGILKTTAGSVLELAVWNNSSDPIWFQLHDKASNPTDGDTCVDQVMVPAGGSVGWRPLVAPSCSTAVRWSASSTPGELTLVAADCCGFSGAVS